MIWTKILKGKLNKQLRFVVFDSENKKIINAIFVQI